VSDRSLAPAEWPVPDRPTRVETCPGVFRDYDNLAADAALQALGTTDAPISRADELAAAVTGAALRATVQARAEQIIKYEHTIETDAGLPVGFLASEALRRLQAARDVMAPGARRDLNVARRRVAATAALCWALLDVIDLELSGGVR
jgi:hypothetical protein